MTSLYTLSEELLDIAREIEYAETEEQINAISLKFDETQDDLNTKISNMCKLMREYETDSDKIQSELKRLEDIHKRKVNASVSIKKYIDTILQRQNISKLDLDIFKLSYRESKACIITDETLIPAEYIKTKEVSSVDKAVVKEKMLAGEVIQGAYIEVRQNLQIN